MRAVVPLYLRLLRLHARLLVAIGAGVAAFEVFMVWVSAQMDTGEGLEAFLEMVLPPEMRDVLFNQFGVGTFEGAVAFGFQHPIFLVAVVAFSVVAGTVAAGERETGFLDLVLARPLPRRVYFLAPLLLVVTGAVLLPLAILAGAAIGLATVDPVADALSWAAYLPATTALTLLLLAVGGISLLAAAASPRRGPATGKAVSLILIFYWLDFVGPLWDVLETARWISPFSYFDPAGSVTAGLNPTDVAVLAGVFAATTVAAFLEFGRQNL